MVYFVPYSYKCVFCNSLLDNPVQSYPILSTKQHNKVPEQLGRVLVQEITVTCALQCFVLGELYDIHLVGLLPNGRDTREGAC